MSSERFVCTECGVRAAERGDCAACGEGPLVDSDDQSAIEVLRQLDQQAADKRRRQITAIAVPIGMAAGGALAFVVPAMLPIPFGRPLQAVVMMALVAFGVVKGLGALWPPNKRFAFLDGEMSASVRGAVGAMQMAETRRPLIIVGVLAVIGTGIGVFAYLQGVAAEQEKVATRARAAQAWADMQQCLLGDELVRVSSTAGQVRRIELAGNDPKKEGAWPHACAEHVTALFESLDDRDFGPQLKQELRDRFGCEGACNPNEPGSQLEGLAAVVAAAGIDHATARVAAPTMVTDTFITKEEIGQIAPGDARIQGRDYLADGTARYLFNSRGQGLSYCEIAPDAADGRTCGALSLPISSGMAKLVEDAGETIIEGRARALDAGRYFDTRGRDVALYEGKADGFVLSAQEERRYLVEHVAGGEVKSDKKLKLPEKASQPILVDDFVLWIAPNGADERALFARSLSVEREEDEEKIATKKKEVGPAGTIAGTPQICRAGDETVLLFGRTLSTWSLLFEKDGTFAGPVTVDAAKSVKHAAKDEAPKSDEPVEPKKKKRAENAKLRAASEFGMIELLNSGAGGDPDAPTAPWGRDERLPRAKPVGEAERNMWADQLGGLERAKRAPLPRHAFSCGGGVATLTWREANHDQQVIHQVRCQANGCTHEEVALSGIDVKTWWSAATLASDAGDQVLLVWRDNQGLLRRRVAALKHLATAEDVRVMDSAEHGGPTTLDLEAVFGRRAVVFVFRGKGFHALRFAADGTSLAL